MKTRLITLLALSIFPMAMPAQTVLKNERYGPAERNVFDIVLPVSDKPTPLVIYIHGGGFTGGDKNVPFEWRKQDVAYFLEHNIAFASINYSYYKTNDSLGVNRCLKDVRTALQFIRHHADRYNISKELIGCYGHSAGAGSSLFLAFHDDFALKNDTTLLGESTRIKCAGALDTQATYDLFRWMDFIPNLKMVVNLMRKSFYAAISGFYGYPDYESFKPVQARTVKPLDMLNMISPDDPPIYVMNLQKQRFPVSFGIIEHHRKHALILDRILNEQKVEHQVYVRKPKIKKEADIKLPVREFLTEHLKHG